ncbi:Oidioi.mRNA.OKI2018_I69.XSR.g13343.t1.cds [Oikopleura dioica]|uniref:Oidioi.mRNA.OKI2018_I69.XSR.g13343.t1.cds n=1 Tax=Oikopleura dioica TaxID=34765 RepID=A0ABN7S8C2_OIKDI|nr:Oidioi.mRNA.OKI2018_I69.XSR.g13343.t1.cds [Oikopleura dioica]
MRISEERALVFAELSERMNAIVSAKIYGRVLHSELDDDQLSEKTIEFYDDGIGYDIYENDGVYTALVDLNQDGKPSMVSVIASGPNITATVDRQVYLGHGQSFEESPEQRLRRSVQSLIQSNTQVGTLSLSPFGIELVHFQRDSEMTMLRATVDGRIQNREVFLRLPNSTEIRCCFEKGEISFKNDATHDLVAAVLEQGAPSGQYIIKLENTEDITRNFRYKIFSQKKLPEKRARHIRSPDIPPEKRQDSRPRVEELRFTRSSITSVDGNYKPCLDQFEHYLGKCWLFVGNEMNYEGASTYCRQKSAALPFVNSSDSFFALYDLVKYKQKNRRRVQFRGHCWPIRTDRRAQLLQREVQVFQGSTGQALSTTQACDKNYMSFCVRDEIDSIAPNQITDLSIRAVAEKEEKDVYMDYASADGNWSYIFSWTNPDDFGARNEEREIELRIALVEEAPFEEYRLIERVQTIGFSNINRTARDITSCPKNLPIDLAIYLAFESDELINATAVQLHSFFNAALFYGSQDFQAEYFGYRPWKQKSEESGLTSVLANETTDFFVEFENPGRRDRFKSFKILIHDKSFGMQNYFSNLEKPLTFWKSAPVDVSITLGESADDRGADFVGQADIGQIVKDLCQAADKYNRYIKVAALDPAKNVGRASRALMIPVKMTPAEFEVEPPQRKEVKEKKSGPKLGGAIAGGVTGLLVLLGGLTACALFGGARKKGDKKGSKKKKSTKKSKSKKTVRKPGKVNPETAAKKKKKKGK